MREEVSPVSNEVIGIALVFAVAVLMIALRHFSLSPREGNSADDWTTNRTHARGS